MGMQNTFESAMTDLAESHMSTFFRESIWMFPTLETLHVVGIVVVLFAIVIMDLRIRGLFERSRSAGVTVKDMVPLAWVAFGIAVVSGVGMFLSSPVEYAANKAFLVKLGLLVLAGVNMALFHWNTRGEVSGGQENFTRRFHTTAGAVVSLTTWLGVIFAGRWIGFML